MSETKFGVVHDILRGESEAASSNLKLTQTRIARLRDELSGLEAEEQEDLTAITQLREALTALGAEAA